MKFFCVRRWQGDEEGRGQTVSIYVCCAENERAACKKVAQKFGIEDWEIQDMAVEKIEVDDVGVFLVRTEIVF